MGVVHKEGDEWYDDTTCELSRCKSGAVKSKPAKAMCPPPPSDLNCRLVKGGCCPRYDCQAEIRCPASDSFDIVCITNYDQCHIDDDCEKNQICCPVGGCGNNCINLCIDDSGQAHGVGETWQDPDDPCTTHTCLRDGTTATASYGCLDCSTNPSSCIWARPEGECCGGWNCSNPFADLDKADDPNCVYAVTLS
ncbi:uncharacterized protein LOC122244878 [Penaeus japonicus]|uniref:uncharacterized protein LOC122244878 n=1 Tax=Penaeus japonicus TaxID=27405 RepID=UPI001C7138E1|nr:uncharacterized protein LOC122244878 [Penaeus japonicus]